MDFLDGLSPNFFETSGLIVGISANVIIGIQVYKEYKSAQVSSLSLGYVTGWLFIFIFWFLYGIRFDAKAITISNALAASIQSLLLVVVIRKNHQTNEDKIK